MRIAPEQADRRCHQRAFGGGPQPEKHVREPYRLSGEGLLADADGVSAGANLNAGLLPGEHLMHANAASLGNHEESFSSPPGRAYAMLRHDSKECPFFQNRLNSQNQAGAAAGLLQKSLTISIVALPERWVTVHSG